MSTKGFFEGIIRNAREKAGNVAIAKHPRYSSVKNDITEALAQLEIAIKYEEISKSDGILFKNELSKIYDTLCKLPEIRKKGLRQ